MKKIIISLCLVLTMSVVTPVITNIGIKDAEASVVGKSYTQYISKANTKQLYKNMKNAQKYGGWASIGVGLIPGGQAVAIAMALSSSATGKKEIEKAYHKGWRLKITYTYGSTMSTNKRTFKAVK